MCHVRSMGLTSLAGFAAISWIAIARAETTAPPTTQPLRTIAVVGTAEARYQTNIDGARKQAVASSYDAALADAKQNAERATKVLGVHLGAPVTVDAPSFGERFSQGEPSGRATFATIESSVRIVFELVP